MRWFKHISAASSDEAMSELMDEFGVEGYGIWWLVLEKIAQTMDKTDCCFARFSIKVWSTSCRVSPKKFQKFVKFLEKKKIFSLKFDGNYIEIECRNLLKYRDEYSKKKDENSGQAPEFVRSLSGVCPEQDTETQAEAELRMHIKEIKKKKSLSSDVQKVFDAWVLTMNKPCAILGPKRIAVVKKALGLGYDVDQLIDAIVGCSLTPFNMGNNKEKRKFIDLELILRDEKHIEDFGQTAKNRKGGSSEIPWENRKFDIDDWLDPKGHAKTPANEVIDNDE